MPGMKPIRRQYQLFVDRPPQAVFEFLTTVKNWSRIMPEDDPILLLSGEDVELHTGSRVVYQVKRSGALQTVALEIADWTPPHGFTERQVQGLYVAWTHRHRFAEFQGGTLMTDIVEYLPTSGPLAALQDKLFTGSKLDAYFHHRQQETKRLLELVGRIKGRDAG
jgi:ligand-binding SRPBCC domain-containing protein